MRRRPPRRAWTHRRKPRATRYFSKTKPATGAGSDTPKQAGLPAFFAVTIGCVIVVVAIDTLRHRRLHPAFGWGAALLIAAVPARIAFAHSDTWLSMANWLIAPSR